MLMVSQKNGRRRVSTTKLLLLAGASSLMTGPASALPSPVTLTVDSPSHSHFAVSFRPSDVADTDWKFNLTYLTPKHPSPENCVQLNSGMLNLRHDIRSGFDTDVDGEIKTADGDQPITGKFCHNQTQSLRFRLKHGFLAECKADEYIRQFYLKIRIENEADKEIRDLFFCDEIRRETETDGGKDFARKLLKKSE